MYGYNELGLSDDELRQQLQQYMNENGDEFQNAFQAHSGLLGDVGADAGSTVPFAEEPQVPNPGVFQAESPNAPVTPQAPEAANGIAGIAQPTRGGSDMAENMIQVAQEAVLPSNNLLAQRRQADEAANKEALSKKGGGLLGGLLKMGLNYALGNWLGGVGSRALGTVGDAFNKAFKIKGIGAK